MATARPSRKLGFPGILDKKYHAYREQLAVSDKPRKRVTKSQAFKMAADRLLPGWDSKLER